MRRALLLLAATGAALLAVGVVRGFLARAAVLDGATTALLALGALLCCAALAAAVVVERRGDGLAVPEGVRLPQPAWGGPLLLVALCCLVGGAYASPPLLVAGAVLLAVALARVGRRDVAQPDRRTVLAARRLQAFGAEHAVDGDGGVRCALEHTGRGNVRIVAIGRDGAYGDVVVNGPERAELVAELAGATVEEQESRDFGTDIRTGTYEWRRMAGLQLEGGQPGR